VTEYFHWDPAKLSLDVPEMDREHQTLIRYMNALHDLYVMKAPAAEQGKALKALAEFTVKHFADEEAYMAKIGYPGLKIHQGTHKNLLDKVGAFAAAFQASGKLGDDLFVFLRMWLSAHICGIDMKYSTHAHGG
jgi:hemerythrin-like metal-binding protein